MNSPPGPRAVPPGSPIDFTEEDMVASAPNSQPEPRIAASRPDPAPLAVGHDVHRFKLTSHRGAASLIVLPVKRLLRRLLHPALARQAESTVAATEALEALQSAVGDLWAANHAMHQRVSALEGELTGHRQWAQSTEARVGLLERHADVPGLELPLDRFRGAEEVIREHQRQYVALFEGLHDVLDLGCGRGEFLELLREARIESRGIDLDPASVRRCTQRGLNVRQADALQYLAASPRSSLGGVLAAQVIERLPIGDVARIVELSSTRLRPGGVLVLETVNPLCFTSLANFWLDPAHRRPVHPELLRWLAETHGFVEVEIRPTTSAAPAFAVPPLLLARVDDAEALAAFNAGIDRVNDSLFGAQDYALVARRAP